MQAESLSIYLREKGWGIAFQEERQPKAAEYVPYGDLALSKHSLAALGNLREGMYRHQREGIERYLTGANVAVTTATASGKTLIFNVCALEELANNAVSRVAAIYPLKALASEQQARWRVLLAQSGMAAKVGRIDGGIQVHDRLRILSESRVVVMTPDIVHAWLFSNLASPKVLDFLRNLTLVIVDEAHTYSGVFGSNASFLFRRIVHLCRKLGGNVRFIASSATMKDAVSHLAQLTGEAFEEVGPERDTSPRAGMLTILANPPKDKDLLTTLSDLITHTARSTDHQSITFVDSRKQTEYLAAIIDRKMNESGDEETDLDLDRLKELDIYPYRSGYEEDDRAQIQKRLAAGSLKGVISTSALEMGIDLPYLSLGILVGMPRSSTSYFQRIGRVGRRKDGIIVVVNNGSVVSEAIFREPERLKQLPLVQSALYLHNQCIQYIHAMCLARRGGEDEIVSDAVGVEEDRFTPRVEFPGDFQRLCNAERVGEIASDLQSMKSQAGDDPNHTYPLRDLDVQFQVECRQGPNIQYLGSLSQSQLMREAYPGAVYYYQTRSYRVVRIKKTQRIVSVRPERRYFTTPTVLPPLILPNLSGDNVFQAMRYGDLLVTECSLQIGEAVVGFKERRGNNEFYVQYPLDASLGMFFDMAKFARYVFTSGVVLTHPVLNEQDVKPGTIAAIVDEAFLMASAFERQDISAGADRHRATRDGVKEGDRFVCLYDQTYGSLRLTSRLVDPAVLRSVLSYALDIARNDPNFELNSRTLAALEQMVECSAEQPESIGPGGHTLSTGEQYVPIILPGSIGVNLQRDNEEFLIEGVFYSPQLGCLAYRGVHVSDQRRAAMESSRFSKTTIAVAVPHVQPLAGVSSTGFYDVETGEILDHVPVAGEF
jgi:DEAD/DEAH box helicase domain-containing protein